MTILAFTLLVFAAPLTPNQAVREVLLPSKVTTHLVKVRGWPGTLTGIRFPDSFTTENVMCADCIDADVIGETPTGAERAEALERNWILERRPKERTLFLRPARMPSRNNPVAGFRTNLVVTLDGGSVVNLQIELWQAPQFTQDKSPESESSDAVVTLRFPEEKSHSSRINAEKVKLESSLLANVQEANRRWIEQTLNGDIKCRTLRVGFSTRKNDVVLRATRVCQATHAKSSTAWVQYVVENRGEHSISLGASRLEVDGVTDELTAPSELAPVTLNFGEQREGVALLEHTANGPLELLLEITQDESFVLKVGKIKC